MAIFRRKCPNGASNARKYEKIAIFDQYLALSPKWCKLEPQLLWKTNMIPYPSFQMVPFPMTLNNPLTHFLRSRHCLMLHISETIRDTDMDLHTPYWTLSFQMTLSDLEWLSEIFSDTMKYSTKRLAVSLRQLSFLCQEVIVSCRHIQDTVLVLWEHLPSRWC